MQCNEHTGTRVRDRSFTYVSLLRLLQRPADCFEFVLQKASHHLKSTRMNSKIITTSAIAMRLSLAGMPLHRCQHPKSNFAKDIHERIPTTCMAMDLAGRIMIGNYNCSPVQQSMEFISLSLWLVTRTTGSDMVPCFM